MRTSHYRYTPVLGTVILLAGPFLLSYPFLAAWNRAGNYSNPFSAWLYPVLLLSLVAGCTGFITLRFRTSIKLLMLLLYIPTAVLALLVWSYTWCSLCDF
ncbi:hypothetical protein [Novosphingobium sp. SG707]|uniref:hypothetical protein n=1 Tax=Novosphingobium sp. SG707 TaxID=2586996 RepID=UPI00144800EA|nr:hypothetical protein [Novosphingobium sp. SG707]NKJ00723.1 hypothetical protein [Novosphingobium sp. SG707]